MLASIQNKLRLSQAGRITLGFCIALTCLTIGAWCIYQFDPRRVAWGDYMSWERMLALLMALCLTLVSVYWASRFWLEENPIAENQTRNAWNAGQQQFGRLGSRIQDQPLFLVIGNEARQVQRQMLTAAGENIVFETPQVGEAPISWFATARATYLCCTGVGVLGPTLKKLQVLSGETPTSAVFKPTNYRAVADKSINDSTRNPTGGESATDISDDSEPQGHPEQGVESSRASAANEPSGAKQLQGSPLVTAVPQVTVNSPDAIARAQASLNRAESLVAIYDQSIDSEAPRVATTACSAEPLLHSTELLHGQRELLQLATQLKSGRRPTVAINGVTLMVDLSIMRTDIAARHCGRAIRQDLALLETTCGAHVPTSVLITGAEKLPGISETIRRLGSDAANGKSIGKSCDPRAELNETSLSGFVDHCTGSMRRCAHELFADSDALTKPGNAQLAQLLLASRGRFANCLHGLMQEAFGDRVQRAGKASFLSGVFLVANGSTPTQRGFSRVAIHNIFAQQQFVEWTEQEQRVQSRTNWAITALFLFCIANAMAFVWQVLG